MNQFSRGSGENIRRRKEEIIGVAGIEKKDLELVKETEAVF